MKRQTVTRSEFFKGMIIILFITLALVGFSMEVNLRTQPTKLFFGDTLKADTSHYWEGVDSTRVDSVKVDSLR